MLWLYWLQNQICTLLNHEPICEAGKSVNFIESITLGIVGKGCESLNIGNWVLYSGILLYLHHRNSKLFFPPVTTSKMRKFQTLEMSQFHKAKTCWTENWWSSVVGLWATFEGSFFYVFLGKNSLNFFSKIS